MSEVPIFWREVKGAIAIFAVQDGDTEDARLTLIAAGSRPGRRMGGDDWDGKDRQAVLEQVVRPRVEFMLATQGSRR